MSATAKTLGSLSLLSLAVRAIFIEASNEWNAGETTKAEAFKVARDEYEFTYGEFSEMIREGRALGVIVEGAFEDTIKTVECCCMDCDSPASFRSELDPDKVICNVCREIELDQL